MYENDRAAASRITQTVETYREIERTAILFIDTETTGLDTSEDEVLQLAIVRLDGTVAYDGYFKPRRKRSWPAAEKVNHISPEMVADKPSILDEKDRIEGVFTTGRVVCGWNTEYDVSMLRSSGIDFPEGVALCDLMPAFCSAWRKGHPDYPEDRNRERLVRVTKWLGIEHDAHDALGDTVVLPPIWDWVVDRVRA